MESRRHHPALPPFPAPKKTLSSGTDNDALSPADSVFMHQDSASSDDYKSAPEHTPSPDRGGDESAAPAATTAQGDLVVDPPTPQGGRSLERVSSSSPQQNTEKISEFHKSLSDLAHTFSSILISEDEKEVLQSAE